ncbi:hypothetical protein A5844_001541 [Enterococcus sp. 10A9_DIV0425]|uniref:Chitin-binding type-4 domain-containing protein n=1 Tax=Candidatus Enterococcus wittei TaxID=1987383 RepID=A0A242K2Y8_9ENTE|nr:lytic polysaccharide monooxygenase [Enterococcus sp. 10A9_DIV0425]OTP11406.1 hypothetical protein A5844_001541 [Enterococcus sp. 10A9_DIV0425]THE11959.1 chitin-binding protein [Enterococcus hirae]
MKKQTLVGLGMILATTGLTALSSVDVSAHGYVSEPISRGYQGNLDKAGNWNAAFQKYGKVIDEPQSLEAPKGFPAAGPADGKIASANGAVGDFLLDQQTSALWTKQNLTTGANTFTWTFTANHVTTKWHYYITKNGWDQNKPLTRDELEPIGEIQGNGAFASTNPTHTVNIPNDHFGYHVILAVWDIDDTAYAFYNVIDANIQSKTPLTDIQNTLKK